MLPESAVKRIKNYPYQSNDQSVLINYVKPVANYLINFIPIYISPNIITLFGLGLILTSTIVQHIFTSVYSAIFCAICILSYQIIDILDGLQGKRTGMYNNPTTEIFDHGCDSMTTVLTVLNIASIFNMTTGTLITTLLFLGITTVFYAPTWEHIHTQIMQFRAGLSNPTESLIITQLGFILASVLPFLFQHYTTHILLVTTLLYSAYNSLQSAIRQTKINTQTISSLIPLLLIWIYSFYNNNTNSALPLLLLIPPWLISVLELIWAEITHMPYNLIKVITVFSIHFLISYFNVPIFALLTTAYYLYSFAKHVNTLCKYLNMKNWYSLPSQQLTIKENTDNQHTQNSSHSSSV